MSDSSLRATEALLATCQSDMSNALILDTTYTCKCGRSEYNDVVLVYGAGKSFNMPHVTTCPHCGKPPKRAPRDRWAAGKIEKMMGTGRGLYVWGSFGTCKTQAAERIRDEAGAMGLNVAMLTSARYISKVTDTYGTFEREADVVDSYAAKQLLIIDDIGNEKLNEHNLSKIWDLVDARYSKGRPTVYTSNYSLDKLVERYAGVNSVMAESLGSRIYGTTDSVEKSGEDRRLA